MTARVYNAATRRWDPIPWGVTDPATAWHYQLGPGELYAAELTADMTMEESRANGHRPTHAASEVAADELRTREVLGWAGEIAASSRLNLPWPGGLTGHGPDLEPDVAVRTRAVTGSLDPGLCYRPPDNPAFRYLLLVAHLPHLWLVGWRWGHECRRPEWVGRSGTRPVWYVPQEALRRMDTWT